MKRLPAPLYRDLLGQPYLADARGPHAYDCVGLAVEIQRRRGVIVPDFVSDSAELHRQMADGGFLAGCRRLENAEAGCVVLAKLDFSFFHLGTMIDRYRMLHTTFQTGGVVAESILGPLWERRILGYYAMETA